MEKKVLEIAMKIAPPKNKKIKKINIFKHIGTFCENSTLFSQYNGIIMEYYKLEVNKQSVILSCYFLLFVCR